MAIELIQPTLSLQAFQQQNVLPLETRAAGNTYKRLLSTFGNSLLSSVYIRSIPAGAALTVIWYQTTGGTEDVGEKQTLGTHQTFTDADVGVTQTILVPRIHNKPFVEAIVSSDDIEFSVYASCLTQNASDIDAALQLDGATADLLNDKGVPQMCYDEAQNKFFFLRCVDGLIPVSIGEEGESRHFTGFSTTTPGSSQDLITETVPTSKEMKLNRCVVRCRAQGQYFITADGATIGSGFTGPGRDGGVFTWQPRNVRPAGEELKVTFTAISGTPTGVDVKAYLMANETDV